MTFAPQTHERAIAALKEENHRQAARIRELEEALAQCADEIEDMYDGGDIRACPETVAMARRILAEGSVKA